MANEINAVTTTGKTLYCTIVSLAGQYWNAFSAAFENYSGANWVSTKYCLALSDANSVGQYRRDFPAGITTPGIYVITVYQQVGGSPATSDTVLGAGKIEWTGSAEAYVTSDTNGRVQVQSGTSAGQISLASGQVTVGTNNDKTGYTASTVSDKTGYSLAGTPSVNVTQIAGQTASAAAGVTFPGTIAAQSDVQGLLTLANGVETSLTLQQALRLIVAASAGKVSGAATTTIVINDTTGTKNRITATVDSNGNRSSVTYDLT